MARIRRFKSIHEAAEFWDTHDFEDYVDATHVVAVTVRLTPPGTSESGEMSVGAS